jgi:hypothetical protein
MTAVSLLKGVCNPVIKWSSVETNASDPDNR